MAENKSSMKSLRAYEKIRDMILKGSKLPGTRLVLSDLEAELGIGRGPIREAIMRLDRSGLVKNIPYKGAVVAKPPTRREILHIYDLRVEVEVKLAVEAMPLLKASDLETMENILDKMETLPTDHYHFDREFHYTLYNVANLPHLFNIAKALILSVESVLNIYRREENHCLKFNAEHHAILKALKANDPQRVKEALSLNVQSGLDIIKDTYSKMLRVPFE